MIPVMIVPVLTRPTLLYDMLWSIDVPVERFVIIDNGDCVNRVILTEACRFQSLTYLPFPSNLGVATSWNLGIKATPFAPWWMVVNFDVTWPQGSLGAFASEARRDALVLSGGAPPWCAFSLGDEVVRRVGLFDEALHPAYYEDNDYERRCRAADIRVHRSEIPVRHENSSTLRAGYQGKNARTFDANRVYYEAKQFRGDMSEGGWSLSRRRELSWD